MRIITLEGKLTSPLAADEKFPLDVSNIVVDDALVQLFQKKGNAQPDGSYTAGLPLNYTIHATGPLGIKIPIKIAGELIATLGPETA